MTGEPIYGGAVMQLWTYERFLADYKKASAPYDGPLGRLFLWTTPMYFTPMQTLIWTLQKTLLEKAAGTMEKVAVPGGVPATIA